MPTKIALSWLAAPLGVAVLATACGRTARLEPAASLAGAGGQGQSVAGSTPAAGASNAGESFTAGAPPSTTGGAPAAGAGNAGASFGGQGGGTGGNSEAVPVKVSGIVVAVDESPIAGVLIRVAGAATTTAADGSFEIEATVPYDLALYQPHYVAGRDESVLRTDLFFGVTLTQLKLYGSAEPLRSSEAAGSVTLPVGTEEEGTTLIDMWSGAINRGPNRSLELPDEQQDFRFDEVTWSGPVDLSASLLIFRTDGPLNYSGENLSAMSVVPVALEDGKVTRLAPVALSKPSWHSLQLQVDAQAARFDDCEFGVRAGDHLWVYFSRSCQPGAAVVNVPDGLPEGTLSVYARSFASQHEQAYEVRHAIGSNATQATLTLPDELLTFDSPAPGFSGKVSEIVLAHQPLERALGVLDLTYFDEEAQRWGRVAVHSDDVRIPFARIIAGVPGMKKEAEVTWELSAIGDVATVDDYLDPERFAASSWAAIFVQARAGTSPRKFSYRSD